MWFRVERFWGVQVWGLGFRVGRFWGIQGS